MASAAARCSLDVSAAGTVAEIRDAVRAETGRGWLRVWGHDDDLLDAPLTMADLDAAVPGRPVVAHDRTGHTAVVNGAAASEIGATGLAPDGVLVERHDLLARAPGVPAADLDRAVAAVAAEWWAAGWTALTDATHTNGVSALEQFDRWRRSGAIPQEVTAMVSLGALAEVPAFGERAGSVTVGWAKIMPRLDPAGDGDASLDGAVAGAVRAGFPVAVHVMDVDTLDVTLAAMEAVPAPPGTFHRVEHCALALPEQVGRLGACGAAVVVNPSFLLHRAAKYAPPSQRGGARLAPAGPFAPGGRGAAAGGVGQPRRARRSRRDRSIGPRPGPRSRRVAERVGGGRPADAVLTRAGPAAGRRRPVALEP